VTLKVLPLGVESKTVTQSFTYTESISVVSAQYSASYTTITLTTNQAINPTPLSISSGTFACSTILAAESVTKLGSDVCAMTSPTTIELTVGTPGAATGFIPNDEVMVLASSLSDAQGLGSNAAAAVPLQDSPTASDPVGAISGLNMIGPCDTLVLDASSSIGAGDLDYFWTCPNDATMNTALKAYSSSTIELDASALATTGFEYELQLVVQDFTGKSSVALTHVASKTDLPVPRVKLEGETARTVVPGDAVNLKVFSEFSGCVSTRQTLSFAWSQVTSSPYASDAVTIQGSGNSMYVAPNTLTAGKTYAFKVSASPTTDPGSITEFVATVSVQLPDVVASIAGGDGEASTADQLTIDASGSSDPAGAGALSYSWVCVDVTTGAACRTSAGTTYSGDTTATLNVPANTFTAGTYTFTVTVSGSSDRAASTSVTLILLAASRRTGSVPRALVQLTTTEGVVISSGEQNGYSYAAVVDPDQKLILSCSVAGSTTATFAWSELNSASFGTALDLTSTATSLLGSTGTNLVLAANALKQGAVYNFACAATDSGATGTGSLAVMVNTAPAGGACSVSPSSGYALETTFTVSCNGWMDSTPQLQYSFSTPAGMIQAPGSQNSVSFQADSTLIASGSSSATVTLTSSIIDDMGTSTAHTTTFAIAVPLTVASVAPTAAPTALTAAPTATPTASGGSNMTSAPTAAPTNSSGNSTSGNSTTPTSGNSTTPTSGNSTTPTSGNTTSGNSTSSGGRRLLQTSSSMITLVQTLVDTTLADAVGKGNADQIYSILRTLGDTLTTTTSSADATTVATLREQMLTTLSSTVTSAVPGASMDEVLLQVQPLAKLSRGSTLSSTSMTLMESFVNAVSGGSIDTTLGAAMVSALANIRATATTSTASATDVSSVTAKYSLFQNTISKAVVSSMAAGEPSADISSSEASLAMYAQRLDQSTFTGTTLTVGGSANASVNFPASVATAISSSVTSTLSSTSLAYNAVDLFTSSSTASWALDAANMNSNTAGFTLSAASQSASNLAPIAELAEDITITLPETTAGTASSCSFWDTSTSAWSVAGCSMCSAQPESGAACCCNHLTDFGLTIGMVPTSAPTQATPTAAPTFGATLSGSVGLAGVTVEEFNNANTQLAFKESVVISMGYNVTTRRAVTTSNVGITSYTMVDATDTEPAYLNIDFTVNFDSTADADSAEQLLTTAFSSGAFATTLAAEAAALGITITPVVTVFTVAVIDNNAAAAASSGGLSGGIIALIVILCILFIGGAVGLACYFNGRGEQQQSVRAKMETGDHVAIEMNSPGVAMGGAPAANSPAQPPPGAVYMKNGVWLDINQQPCAGQQL